MGRPVGHLRARGDSMFPLIPDDTLLLVDSTAPWGPGDVVLLEFPGGKQVAHRVVAIRDGMVVTRGDNLAWEDPPVPCDKVIGPVTAMYRKGLLVDPARPLFRMVQSAVLLAMRLLRGRSS